MAEQYPQIESSESWYAHGNRRVARSNVYLLVAQFNEYDAKNPYKCPPGFEAITYADCQKEFEKARLKKSGNGQKYFFGRVPWYIFFCERLGTSVERQAFIFKDSEKANKFIFAGSDEGTFRTGDFKQSTFFCELTVKFAGLVARKTTKAAAVDASQSWWCNTDEFGGQRQVGNSSIYLFPAKSNRFQARKFAYNPPAGFTWVTAKDAEAELKKAGLPKKNSEITHYYGQGGWDGYSWKGMKRRAFYFKDSKEAQAFLDAFATEGEIYHGKTAGFKFAGIVAKKG